MILQNLLFLFVLGLYFPLALVLNRLLCTIQPRRRNQPAQGTFALSGLAAFIILLPFSLLLPSALTWSDRISWLLFSSIILSCQFALFVSVLAVSESGRRFFLMHVISRQPGIRKIDLYENYGREHLLDIRLQRLIHWNALQHQNGRYFSRKTSAYLYSLIFLCWGRLLGFRWKLK